MGLFPFQISKDDKSLVAVVLFLLQFFSSGDNAEGCALLDCLQYHVLSYTKGISCLEEAVCLAEDGNHCGGSIESVLHGLIIDDAWRLSATYSYYLVFFSIRENGQLPSYSVVLLHLAHRSLLSE